MNQTLILYPLFGMVAIVCIVAGVMLRRRIAFYRTNRVHPQKTALSAQMAATITDSRAADNFRNLFELPVLFYTAILMAFTAKLASPLLLGLAWVYVLARAAHSFIQCGSNNVMRRFYAFVTSCTALLVMWIVLLLTLLK